MNYIQIEMTCPAQPHVIVEFLIKIDDGWMSAINQYIASPAELRWGRMEEEGEEDESRKSENIR